MIETGPLTTARPLAQHSARLAARALAPEELVGALAEAAARLEKALAEGLRPLLSGELAVVTCGKVEKAAAPRLHKMIDAVAVNLQGGSPQGGIASPLTETAYGDRTWYAERTIASSDGIWSLKIKPLKSIKLTDANSAEVVINLKNRP